MHCNTVSMCQAGERFDLRNAEHSAATIIMGIFNTEEGCWSRVFVTTVANVYLDLAWVKHTIVPVRHDAHWRTPKG